MGCMSNENNYYTDFINANKPVAAKDAPKSIYNQSSATYAIVIITAPANKPSTKIAYVSPAFQPFSFLLRDIASIIIDISIIATPNKTSAI